MTLDRDPADILRNSPLFDADFYCANLKERDLEGLEPIAHYIQKGEAAKIAPNLLFDSDFYAENNPDVAASGLNLLQHYIVYGAREGRNPHPLIDLAFLRTQVKLSPAEDPLIAYLRSQKDALRPHPLFDAAFVAAQQEDLRPTLVFYLTSDGESVDPSKHFSGRVYRKLYPQSRDMNPLVHYVRFGRAQGLRMPTGDDPLLSALEDIEAAALLEPDIVKPCTDPRDTHLLHGYDSSRAEFRLFRRLTATTGARTHPYVIIVPWLRRGGADRAVIALATALLKTERVLIVCTQSDEREALDWAPITSRLSVACLADVVGDTHDLCVAFCNCLRFIQCRYLFVMNSAFGFQILAQYGKTLKSMMRLFAFAFCQDYDEYGRRADYGWTKLRQVIDVCDNILTDNSRMLPVLAQEHSLDARDCAKVCCLPLPVDERLFHKVQARHYRTRHRALWAGRFAWQKGLDIACEIAQNLPDCEIVAFGGEDAPVPLISGGPFRDFAELPLGEASFFLHTARWEGLPNVLLEAGASGLPIVAFDVGGVGDILDTTTGWPVAFEAGVQGCVNAIRALLADPQEAARRAQAMQERIGAKHNETAFAQAVQRLLAGAS